MYATSQSAAANSQSFFTTGDKKKKRMKSSTKGASLKVLSAHDITQIEPLTESQGHALLAWDSPAIVMYGSAGTGKTFLAMHMAIREIVSPKSTYDHIVIVRSVVPTREIGYLPGTMEEKVKVYEDPYESIVTEITGKPTAYEKMKETGQIEFHTTSFLRGTTFKGCIVIFDEFQNATDHEILTVLTRLGTNTKIILCGDNKQNDLLVKKNDTSGFATHLRIFEHMQEQVKLIEFTPEDIVRSGWIKSYLIARERLGV